MHCIYYNIQENGELYKDIRNNMNCTTEIIKITLNNLLKP